MVIKKCDKRIKMRFCYLTMIQGKCRRIKLRDTEIKIGDKSYSNKAYRTGRMIAKKPLDEREKAWLSKFLPTETIIHYAPNRILFPKTMPKRTINLSATTLIKSEWVLSTYELTVIYDHNPLKPKKIKRR